MAKIAFIVHGKLRAQKKLHDSIAAAFVATDELKFFYTERSYHAAELSQQAIAEGFGYIIGVCGDGTLNEIVNGVMLSQNKEVRVGVFSQGTGNDFVKTLKSPATIQGIAQLIHQNKFKTIDVMEVQLTALDGTPATRYGINITDVGIGGVCAQRLHGSKKLLGATITFQYHIIATFLTYVAQAITVKADSFTYQNKVMNFCICNGKYFGAGLGVAPNADLQDGLLNVVAIGKVNLLDYLKNLPVIKRCEPVNHPAVKYFTAKELTIQSAAANLPVDMDGELAGFLPMKIKVMPCAIKFLV